MDIQGLHFAVAASAVVIILLGLHNHLSNYVYVVFFNNQEVGTVEEAKDVENFISELTDRCGEFYGMNVKPGEEILLVKEFRPDSKPARDTVESVIRQRMTFLTDAYMLTANGMPLVAVHDESDLEEIIQGLKASYSRNSSYVTNISTIVTDNLALEPCIVSPEIVYTAGDVVAMIVESEHTPVSQTAYISETISRGSLESRQSFSSAQQSDSLILAFLSPVEQAMQVEKPPLSGDSIHVRTLEELVIFETIPFDTEIVEDEDMWIVQKEILVEGEEGEKEVVFHVTRENGLEIDRIKVDEKILSEPVTRVEAWGTAQVPSIGTGQFIWPVDGGGGVTPGRGFSTWHTGIDIHTATGTDILAADSGIVWFSGFGGTQGNYIILYHGSFWTLYLHNSVNFVIEGQVVEQGDIIAKAGSTGRSTGPHLHFEVRLDDSSGEWHTYYQHKPIDPLQFFEP
ncbi:MAG: peptidoglycan DD-metalloendopeptidase family protein [Firmicutes bacterium]|nr:peptidoglycan DD-metalloendopeptidase family protein [Bacillota bacterium]